MFYIDTSVIAAYYCPEPLSEKAEDFFISHLQPAISSLTEVELFSAVARKVREGSLDSSDANKITAKFLSHLDGSFYTLLPVLPNHYRLARDWIGQFHVPLKTLDALHLSLASSAGRTIVTSDRQIVTAAERLAVDVLLLEP
jgi:predicted nucleic acid-binding protein